MSSPSTTQVQVQTSSANQPVVMTASNLRGVTSVIPQGAVLMQQAIATSIANQMTGSNQSSQSSPSKVTIVGNKGSSSLSQLSVLAQHPQGQPTAGTTQIQIKPNNVGTTMSNPNPTIQRQVLPVQAIPGKLRYEFDYLKRKVYQWNHSPGISASTIDRVSVITFIH